MTDQQRAALADTAAQALAQLDDNGDFDHARATDPNFPHDAYGQSVLHLRRLRDKLQGHGDYLHD